MRCVIQRVNSASVSVNGETCGNISKGILVLLGVSDEDTEQDIKWLADKIIGLRIFEDENEKMNFSLCKSIYITILQIKKKEKILLIKALLTVFRLP